MPTYDWIVLVTLGLDRWEAERRPRTAYEIERDEAYREVDTYHHPTRPAHRNGWLRKLGKALRRLFRSRQPPCARPQKPASRV